MAQVYHVLRKEAILSEICERNRKRRDMEEERLLRTIKNVKKEFILGKNANLGLDKSNF